jgi:hypothetical protein
LAPARAREHLVLASVDDAPEFFMIVLVLDRKLEELIPGSRE